MWLRVAIDRRDQQHTSRIGWLNADQVHRLRHRQAAELVGALQGVAAQRLRQQVITQRGAETALSLAVQHRHIFVAGRSQLQFALCIELANGEGAQALIPHTLLKRRAFGSTDPQGKRISLGTQQ